MNSPAQDNFIVTREYRRFAEFCEACRRYRYIGLCFGPPGVGKTLSARHYADWDRFEALPDLPYATLEEIGALRERCVLFYTPRVTNTPRQIAEEIYALRQSLYALCIEPLRREEMAEMERIRRYDAEYARQQQVRLLEFDWLKGPVDPPPRTEPTLSEVAREYHLKRRAITDPIGLILVDEADRLRVASLEQLRAIFDQGGIGLILIGMPGLEKRLARYPQLYSRVGFVHEFRALKAEEVRQLLLESWSPADMALPEGCLSDEEALAAIIRITGGNFRLLHRLLTQIARVIEINALPTVTRAVVEAARESLVIGSV